MEPENEESEKEYFENITESRQGAIEHNVTEGGYAVAWLNADRGRILGPARTQEIQEGDTIKLSVFGNPDSYRGGSQEIQALACQFHQDRRPVSCCQSTQ